MSQKQKDERTRRRARCVQAGESRLLALRSGDASTTEVGEMREAVLRGDCPLCGESGFKNIAGHCQKMHGVLSRELRDLLNMTYTESICSPVISATMREYGLCKNPREKGCNLESRVYSKKGDAIRKSNLAPAPTLVSKEVLRENGRRVGLERKGKAPWNKETQHGSRGMYRQGCRCEACVFASKEYNRNLNIRRRSKPSNAALTGATPNGGESG